MLFSIVCRRWTTFLRITSVVLEEVTSTFRQTITLPNFPFAGQRKTKYHCFRISQAYGQQICVNHVITTYPLVAAIGDLSNLMSLDVSQNQLDFLPSSIGRLSNLTRLVLSHNRLSSLPDGESCFETVSCIHKSDFCNQCLYAGCTSSYNEFPAPFYEFYRNFS